MSIDIPRRARLFRRARIGVLAFVIAYFFMPYGVRTAIPVWLLFLAALGLEVEFFLGGYRQMRRGVAQWRSAIDANTIGLPLPAVSGIRVYERFIYLSPAVQ